MRKDLFILLCLLVAGITAYAQPYTSRLGRFQVDQKRGCAPFTITLTNLLAGDCTPGKPCVMDYESNGSNQQNQFTHTYLTPGPTGKYLLKVLYQSVGQDDIEITVDPNTQPDFEIYSCANQQAFLRVIDKNPINNLYDQFVIDFNNDGTPEYTLPSSNNIQAGPSTYPLPAPPQPTSYTMAVRGRRLNAADNCATKTQPFTMKTTLPAPTITVLTSIDATSVKIDFTILPAILYKMEVAVNNSTNFQLLQPVYGISTLTIPNLKLDDNYYCFRLSAVDPCSNGVTPSTIVCTNKFTVTAQSDVNQIVMNTGNIAAVSNFNINRNKVSFFNTTNTTFNDTNIVCKNDYCYQITTIYGGGSKSISLEKCVKSFSNKIPTSITDVTSVATSSSAALSWTQDPKFTTTQYSVLRSSKGSNLAFLSLTPTTSYTDNSYNLDGKFCYQINYTDKCDNIALPGIITCPIRLTGALEKSNAVALTWSAYKGWSAGVRNYSVEKYNLSGTLVATYTVTDTTFVDDKPDATNQLVRYIVKANANTVTLTTPSVSNQVEFIKDANLYYPTAFSPNGDALNEGFRVSGQYIGKISMKVFDRWGALVFATDKNEPWDGSREGKAMPPSTYVWKVEITDLAGRTFFKEGMVALIR